MTDNVTYDLKTPFDYSYQGQMQPASFITISAPSVKQLPSFAPIKQAFSAAIGEIGEKQTVEVQTTGEASTETSGAEVMQLMNRWSGDLVKVYLHAQQLFNKSSVALIDGETEFTVPLMEKMSAEDFECLVGEYIANFIVPSLIGD